MQIYLCWENNLQNANALFYIQFFEKSLDSRVHGGIDIDAIILQGLLLQ